MPTTPEELLTQLAESPPYPYPRSIIQEIIDRQEEMVPALLEVLADAVRRPQHYLEGRNWIPLMFACYLLAQFRATAAFKPLCAVLALPAMTVSNLFGETITEDVGRILASVYDGDPAPLCALVESAEVYEFVRSAAVPNAFFCLLVEAKITREWLEDYATELLDHKLEREPSYVWDGWTCLCAELGFASTVPLIEKAIQEELCDPSFYTFEKRLKHARTGGRDTWKYRTGLINDTIQMTSGWPAWEKPVPPKPRPAPLKLVEARQTPKVGRNDPCPCGSGKKHKKCCGTAA